MPFLNAAFPKDKGQGTLEGRQLTLKSISFRIMAKANDPPLTLGTIIDHIERMREEMLGLQRSLERLELEKLELQKPSSPKNGHKLRIRNSRSN
jgi:hypothetical protein